MENYFGLDVVQVMNVTDIDDKIIAKSEEVFFLLFSLLFHDLLETYNFYFLHSRVSVQSM